MAEEMMDDFSIVDDRLTRALDNLRGVNRLLGGYATTRYALRAVLRTHPSTSTLLDLGTGIADFPEFMVRWADRQGHPLTVTALDANPVTVAYARVALDRRLPPRLRARITVDTGDATRLPYPDDAFDIVHASLFLHHFDTTAAPALLREMRRVARLGVIVNDLHRHPLAYYSILALGKILPVSPMFANDGPVSVLRGFTRPDLQTLAADAGLVAPRIRWHWAFRWSLVDFGPHLDDAHPSG